LEIGGRTVKAEHRRIVGVDLYYVREIRWAYWSMDSAIGKLLKTHGMDKCSFKKVYTPARPSVDLSEGPSDNSGYPLRRVVGGILYIAVAGRPDISFAIARLARFTAAPTAAAVAEAKHLLKCLAATQFEGLLYSPETESQYKSLYRSVLAAGGRDIEKSDTLTFTDADFAGCALTLRSTSGSIVLFRSFPIAWSSKRQALRAHSTCQSEIQGQNDTVELLKSLGFLHLFVCDPEDEFFDATEELPPVLADNTSAIHVAQAEMATKRTKHYMLRYQKVKDWGKAFSHVETGLNLGDQFTKILSADKYVQLLNPWLGISSKSSNKKNKKTDSTEGKSSSSLSHPDASSASVLLTLLGDLEVRALAFY